MPPTKARYSFGVQACSILNQAKFRQTIRLDVEVHMILVSIFHEGAI